MPRPLPPRQPRHRKLCWSAYRRATISIRFRPRTPRPRGCRRKNRLLTPLRKTHSQWRLRLPQPLPRPLPPPPPSPLQCLCPQPRPRLPPPAHPLRRHRLTPLSRPHWSLLRLRHRPLRHCLPLCPHHPPRQQHCRQPRLFPPRHPLLPVFVLQCPPSRHAPRPPPQRPRLRQAPSPKPPPPRRSQRPPRPRPLLRHRHPPQG